MTTIRIICKARRDGGSKIPLYGKVYHFKPEDPSNPESPHVADIPTEDARQIYRLLSIRDTYVLADPNAELPARPAPEKGQTMAGDKAAASGATEAKPVIIKAGDQEYNLADMDLEQLTQLARDEFDIKVHHKWKEPTLIQKIVEAVRAAQGEPD